MYRVRLTKPNSVHILHSTFKHRLSWLTTCMRPSDQRRITGLARSSAVCPSDGIMPVAYGLRIREKIRVAKQRKCVNVFQGKGNI